MDWRCKIIVRCVLLLITSDELELWIREKLKVASEESWRELTNLSAKIQKHQAFETEVNGHKYVIDGLDESGEGMIRDEHFAKDVITVSAATCSCVKSV